MNGRALFAVTSRKEALESYRCLAGCSPMEAFAPISFPVGILSFRLFAFLFASWGCLLSVWFRIVAPGAPRLPIFSSRSAFSCCYCFTYFNLDVNRGEGGFSSAYSAPSRTILKTGLFIYLPAVPPRLAEFWKRKSPPPNVPMETAESESDAFESVLVVELELSLKS